MDNTAMTVPHEGPWNNSLVAAAGPEVLFRLGLRYCTGHEVPRNLVEAHKWFNLAAMSGDRRARLYRGEISREMSPGEIAEAQRQARSWLSSS